MRRRSFVKSWVQVALAIGSIVSTTAVRAESAPATPLELGIALGYHQGFGSVGARVPRLQDLGSEGAALDVDLGWRIDPRWLVGAYVELSLHDGPDVPGTNQTGLAAGIHGQFHTLPRERYDPWIGLGFGWRGLWADRGFGARDHALQGMDLARFQIGLACRVSDTVRMGPVLGFTVTQFLSEKTPTAAGYRDISDRKIDTFLYAGLAGRFGL